MSSKKNKKTKLEKKDGFLTLSQKEKGEKRKVLISTPIIDGEEITEYDIKYHIQLALSLENSGIADKSRREYNNINYELLKNSPKIFSYRECKI